MPISYLFGFCLYATCLFLPTHTVSSYVAKKTFLDKQIDKVEREAKKGGDKLKKEFKKIRKVIK